MLTVRADAELERELEEVARAAGLTKSEFVRRGLQDAIARAKRRGAPTPWDLRQDLFARYRAGEAIFPKLERAS